MAVDVMKELQELIQSILGDRDAALQYVQDPYGTLVAQGITEGDLAGLDMRQMVADSCAGMDLPESVRGPVQSYTGGAGPAAGGGGAGEVMQHLTYVTQVAYHDDDVIQQEITNIDQSQNVNIEGEVHGDVAVDSHDVNANATGDGSAASGFGPATVGDENLVNTGVNWGQQNTGDGAVQQWGVGDAGPVNTGVNTGIMADGPVTNAIVGDDNQAAQIAGRGGGIAEPVGLREIGTYPGGSAGTVFEFGEGDASAITGSQVVGSAVATGGDATNVVGNTVDDGSALGVGSIGTSGHASDDDTFEVDLPLRPPLEVRSLEIEDAPGEEGPGEDPSGGS